MDDRLLVNGDAGSFDGHDALVVVSPRLFRPDHRLQRVAEVLEDELLVLQIHGKHAVQPGGDFCGNPGILLEDVMNTAPSTADQVDSGGEPWIQICSIQTAIQGSKSF